MKVRLEPWVVAATAVALVLRFTRLGSAPLWMDEAVTAEWVALPWTDMLRAAVADNHPPLYFIILKAWAGLAGHSPWALRAPSAVLSTAVVPLVAACAAVLVGTGAARWAAWFAALSPILIHHAQEARMYPLVAVLASAHLLLLGRYLTGRSRRLGWMFILVAAALLGSHYYTLFLVGGELIVLFLLLPTPRRAWVPAAAATAVIGCGAFLAAVLFSRHQAGGEYAMGLLAFPGVIWGMLTGYEFLPSSAALHAEGVRSAFAYLGFAILVAPAFFLTVAVALRSLDHRLRGALLVTLGATLAGPFAVRVALGVGLNPRYFVAGMPALLVLLAAGAPSARGFSIRAPATGVLGLVMILAVALHLRDPSHGREDIRGAAAWLDANIPVEEEILVTSSEMAYLASFHWPERKFRLYPPPGVVVRSDNAPVLAERLPFAHGDRVIYVIGRAWTSDPAGMLQEALSKRYASCAGAEVRGILIRCLDRDHHGGSTRLSG